MPPPARPRLIGLDLDGTILDNRGELPPDVRDALIALARAGVALAFLTGRRPLTTRPKLDVLEFPAFAATNSGCLLWELPAWRQLGRQMFPAELVEPVAELLAPHSANFYVDASSTGFEYFCLQRDSSPQIEQYLERYGQNARVISEPAQLRGCEITQIAVPAPQATVDELRGRIDAHYGDRLLALSVRWPLLPTQALEVFHPQAHKGGALAHFAGVLGVAREDVLAIGDDTNDIAMLTWAGWSAAMPHAQAEVRAYARETLQGDGPAALAAYLMALLARAPLAPAPLPRP